MTDSEKKTIEILLPETKGVSFDVRYNRDESICLLLRRTTKLEFLSCGDTMITLIAARAYALGFQHGQEEEKE